MYHLRGREKLTKLLSCGILNFFLITQFDSFYNIFKNSGKLSRIKGIFLIIWAYVSFVNFSFSRNPTFLNDSKKVDIGPKCSFFKKASIIILSFLGNYRKSDLLFCHDFLDLVKFGISAKEICHLTKRGKTIKEIF